MYEEAIKQLSHQDWEIFAEDALFHLGFDVLVGPSEGTDEGMDLIVKNKDVKFLVSCKHGLASGKNVGTDRKSSLCEGDIVDRILQHDCRGFLAFYSTGATSGLKKRFAAVRGQDRPVIEIYKTDIFDIIPTMRSFTLQKYFPEVHKLVHHSNSSQEEYKPLLCMGEGCEKDILDKDNIHLSMASLVPHEGKLHMLYGCKQCINSLPDIYWAEITQIRHIEQLLGWRTYVDEMLNEDGLHQSDDFYESWAHLQEGITQVLVPPGWGRWLY